MGLNLGCAPLWCFCKNYKMFEVVPQVEEEKLVFKDPRFSCVLRFDGETRFIVKKNDYLKTVFKFLESSLILFIF